MRSDAASGGGRGKEPPWASGGGDPRRVARFDRRDGARSWKGGAELAGGLRGGVVYGRGLRRRGLSAWGVFDLARAERPDEWRSVVGGEALGGVFGGCVAGGVGCSSGGAVKGAVGGWTRGGGLAGCAVGWSSGAAREAGGRRASERSRAAVARERARSREALFFTRGLWLAAGSSASVAARHAFAADRSARFGVAASAGEFASAPLARALPMMLASEVVEDSLGRFGHGHT